MIEFFLCPVYNNCLVSDGKTLKCKNGHSFDISSEGYVNLALGKSGSGDSPEMCRARRDFLAEGYYSRFAETVAGAVIDFSSSPHSLVCDAGCGKGYYLRTLKKVLPDCGYVGLDLAKTSVRIAAKAEKNEKNRISYAVAGIFSMPILSGCCSEVLSVFAPVPHEEAHRVLRDKGHLIVAHPGVKHLSGFKAKLYESPYDNVEKELSYPGFRKIGEKRSCYSVFVKKKDMKNLLLMTPYCWRTPKDDIDNFLLIDGFETDLDFIVTVFEKI